MKFWYKYLLGAFLIYLLGINTISLALNFNPTALLHVLLVAVIIVLIIQKSGKLKFGIKVWTGIVAIGGILRFISIILFLIAGQPDRIEVDRAIFSGAHLIVSIVLFLYVDELSISGPEKRSKEAG